MELPDSGNPYLSDELLLVRHSGEIPEVALHGSIFFLTEDPNGPGLDLNPRDLQLLKKMVVARYQEIINRDLDPNNRGQSLYRGLARCRCNWQRMTRFCQREGIGIESFRKDVAGALLALLKIEACDLATGPKNSPLNCTARELGGFSEELGVNPEDLPAGWQELCAANFSPAP